MEKLKAFIKNNVIIILIFFLFIVTRLCKFSDVVWYESSQRILQIIQFITVKGQIFHLIPHFPLAVILYKLGALVAGNTVFGVNLIHFILNLLTFFLVYKTSLLFYNDKRVASWSVLLYTISFYAYAGNTMGIDQDLALNPLLFLLTLYLYKKYSFSIKGVILIVISCSLLTISRPILGVIVMGIIFVDMMINYILNNKNKIKLSGIIENIIKFLKLFIPYLVVGGTLCYLMYKLFPSPVIKALNTYKNLFSGNYGGAGLLTKISFLGQVFLYSSPLIVCIFPLFKKFKKHQLLLIASTIMILYMCMGLSGGDPARWMMPILPVFVVLRGVVCSQYINKKNIWLICVIGVVLCICNYLYLDYSSLPNNVSDYISSPLSKVFILTTTIFSPIYLNSKLIFGVVGITMILVVLAILRKDKVPKYILISFALGVNLFLVATDFFHIKQPNITNIALKMSDFGYNNSSIDDIIYSDQTSKEVAVMGLWNKYIGDHFSLNLDDDTMEINNKLYKNPILLSGVNLFSQNIPESDFVGIIHNNGSGFVFLTHYFGNDKEFEILNNKCEIIEMFTGNIKEIYGIIYFCDL